LADFGFTSEARSMSFHVSTYGRGTPCYRAPELLTEENKNYNNKVDIWSMGCILYELAVNRKVFNSDYATLEHKWSGSTVTVRLDEYFSEQCKESITRSIKALLQLDPAQRPTAAGLLKEFSSNFKADQDESPHTVERQGAFQELHEIIANAEVLSLEGIRRFIKEVILIAVANHGSISDNRSAERDLIEFPPSSRISLARGQQDLNSNGMAGSGDDSAHLSGEDANLLNERRTSTGDSGTVDEVDPKTLCGKSHLPYSFTTLKIMLMVLTLTLVS
jgi:serine/threonine protein kinase